MVLLRVDDKVEAAPSFSILCAVIGLLLLLALDSEGVMGPEDLPRLREGCCSGRGLDVHAAHSRLCRSASNKHAKSIFILLL